MKKNDIFHSFFAQWKIHRVRIDSRGLANKQTTGQQMRKGETLRDDDGVTESGKKN